MHQKIEVIQAGLYGTRHLEAGTVLEVTGPNARALIALGRARLYVPEEKPAKRVGEKPAPQEKPEKKVEASEEKKSQKGDK